MSYQLYIKNLIGVDNMNNKLLDILCCPYDKGTLELESKDEKRIEVWEGVLICESCHRVFPIIYKVPYILPDDLKSRNATVNNFFIYNKQYKEIDKFYQKTTYEIWEPGARTWKPDILSKMISKLRGSYPDIIKPYFNSSLFSLDIGCGNNAKGSVNIDIYLPERIPENFIMASAEYLPFQDDIFDLVHSSYVIEHCLNPSHFIEELVRLSNNKVVIITDNSEWIGDYWFRLTGNGRIFHDEHYYRWTVEYLNHLINRLGFKAKVSALNLSPTNIVVFTSLLGRIPRIGRFFLRDIMAVISKIENKRY